MELRPQKKVFFLNYCDMFASLTNTCE